MRLAWVSTETPGLSVQYCREVLQPLLAEEVEVLHCSEADALESCDVALLHFDDSPGKEEILTKLGKIPTLVWIHDVLCKDGTHILEENNYFASLPEASAVACSHERNAAELLKLAEDRGFQLPLRRLLLPYPASETLGEAKPEASEALRLAFSGSPTLESRAHLLLDVLRASTSETHLKWLVSADEVEEAKLLCLEYGMRDVEIYSPRDSHVWAEILSNTDAAVHTHYSAYSDPGPLLAASMMAEKACIVSRFSSTASLPDDCVWKVSPGVGEREKFEALLTQLADKTARAAVAAAARSFAKQHHSAKMVAAELLNELNSYRN